MGKKIKLLDLFSGAGGAAAGYMKAGFEVTGVDIKFQKRYPANFIHADALELLRIKSFIQQFDIIHVSPVCKRYSKAIRNDKKTNHPDNIALVRGLLQQTGKPYIIENVPGSPLKNFVALSGGMFNLFVHRVRWFECNPQIIFPPCDGAYSSAGKRAGFNFQKSKIITVAGNAFKKSDAQIAMGIDWMTVRELAQAVPPAYTHWLGEQFKKMI